LVEQILFAWLGQGGFSKNGFLKALMDARSDWQGVTKPAVSTKFLVDCVVVSIKVITCRVVDLAGGFLVLAAARSC